MSDALKAVRPAVALTDRGKQIRRDTLKLGLPNGIYHYGGSFSVVEILIAIYDFFVKPGDVWHTADRVIMSKGHCWIPQVVILRERGLDPGWGPRLDNQQTCLLGHPKRDIKNGVPATTGSLGHGMPLGVGMALGKKLQRQAGRVYVIVGDGECQEGTFWESLLLARKFMLSGLTVIVDSNSIQGSGHTERIMDMPDLAKIAEAAGWAVAECQGHNVEDLVRAIDQVNNAMEPGFIIANTVKGAGVSYMENDPKWHACYPTEAEIVGAYADLAGGQ
jgi:transketolase